MCDEGGACFGRWTRVRRKRTSVPREERKRVSGCRVRRGTRGVRRVLGRERRRREEPR